MVKPHLTGDTRTKPNMAPLGWIMFAILVLLYTTDAFARLAVYQDASKLSEQYSSLLIRVEALETAQAGFCEDPQVPAKGSM